MLVTQSSLSARLPFSMVQPHLGLDGFDAHKVRGPGRTAHACAHVDMVISYGRRVGLPKVFRLPCPRRTATRALCRSTFIPITLMPWLMRPQAVRPARDLNKHIRFTPELRPVSTGADTRPESTLGENIQYNSH